MNNTMKQLGSRLKALRIKCGYATPRAAEAGTGVPATTTIRTEKEGNPQFDTLLRICSEYGTTVSELTKGLK
jgi:hypothetical protein